MNQLSEPTLPALRLLPSSTDAPVPVPLVPSADPSAAAARLPRTRGGPSQGLEEEEDDVMMVVAEADPVAMLNRSALEMMRSGSYGRAAARLKEALQLVRRKGIRRGATIITTSTRSSRSSSPTAAAPFRTLRAYDVGRGLATAWHPREPLAFHPYLKGMELVRGAAPAPACTSSSPSAFAEASFHVDVDDPDDDALVVGALCYNLGLVYHQLAIHLFHELRLQGAGDDEEEERGGAGHDNGGSYVVHPGRQQQQQEQRRHVDGCLRKALRFYDLVVATTKKSTTTTTTTTTTTGPLRTTTRAAPAGSSDEVWEPMDEGDGQPMDEADDQSAGGTTASDPSLGLLRVASWSNQGHAYYCLREWSQVRHCADELCLALHDHFGLDDQDNQDAVAARPSARTLAASSAPSSPTPTPSPSPGVPLPLAMNVLLYSEIRNPAPSA